MLLREIVKPVKLVLLANALHCLQKKLCFVTHNQCVLFWIKFEISKYNFFSNSTGNCNFPKIFELPRAFITKFPDFFGRIVTKTVSVNVIGILDDSVFYEKNLVKYNCAILRKIIAAVRRSMQFAAETAAKAPIANCMLTADCG